MVALSRSLHFSNKGEGLPSRIHNGYGEQVHKILYRLGLGDIGENLAYKQKSHTALMGKVSTYDKDGKLLKKGRGWKGSQSHNDLLLGDYTYAGIGITEDSKGDKSYVLVVSDK